MFPHIGRTGRSVLSFIVFSFVRTSRSGLKCYKSDILINLETPSILTKNHFIDLSSLKHKNITFYWENSYFTEKWSFALLLPMKCCKGSKKAFFTKELMYKTPSFVRKNTKCHFGQSFGRFWRFRLGPVL